VKAPGFNPANNRDKQAGFSPRDISFHRKDHPEFVEELLCAFVSGHHFTACGKTPNKPLLYQGTTSVVPQLPQNEEGFSP
jgi:hypothetical protein